MTRRTITTRRALLAGWSAGVAVPSRVRAQTGVPTVRLAVLWDRSGTGAVTSGLDQVVAARLAVDDFGQFSRGYPIDLVDKEFHRAPEEAADITRQWLTHDNVAAIFDIPGTEAALRVQDLARSHNRSVMNTGSFNAALTGADCSPTASHWLDDTRTLTMAMALGLAGKGARSWFLVVPDDTVGNAFQAGASKAIEHTGGRLSGFARHPSDAATFAPALSLARDAGADVVALCAMGTALTTQLREARRLGLFDRGKAVCAYAGCIKDVHEVGPREASGLFLVTGFYWNQNDRTRGFARRFNGLTGRMPDKPYAATYAAVEHFLRAVESADTIDGTALNVVLRREPVYFFGAGGRIRVDGSLLLDIGLFQVKSPEKVVEDWDYYEPVGTLTAPEVARAVGSSACSLSP